MGCALFANICYRQEVAKLKFYDGTYTAYDGTELACDGKKFVCLTAASRETGIHRGVVGDIRPTQFLFFIYGTLRTTGENDLKRCYYNAKICITFAFHLI